MAQFQDEHLWDQLEYVISDMNTFVAHMLAYTIAKCVLSCRRRCGESEAIEWVRRAMSELFLERFRMPQEEYEIAMSFVNVDNQARPTVPQVERLRKWFGSIED